MATFGCQLNHSHKSVFVLWVWLILFNRTISSYTFSLVNYILSILFLAQWYPLYAYTPPFLCPFFPDSPLGWSHILAAVNTMAIHMAVWVSLCCVDFSSLGYVLRNTCMEVMLPPGEQTSFLFLKRGYKKPYCAYVWRTDVWRHRETTELDRSVGGKKDLLGIKVPKPTWGGQTGRKEEGWKSKQWLWLSVGWGAELKQAVLLT